MIDIGLFTNQVGAALILGMSQDDISDLVRKGKLRAFSRGSFLVFRFTDLESLSEQKKSRSVAK